MENNPPVSLEKSLGNIREILEKETSWTKGAAACDSQGSPVRAGSRAACSFCLYGAAIRAVGACASARMSDLDIVTLHLSEAVKQFVALPDSRVSLSHLSVGTSHESYITSFNDSPNTSHKDILAVLELAQNNLSPQKAAQ